jgi:hypothetical protein
MKVASGTVGSLLPGFIGKDAPATSNRLLRRRDYARKGSYAKRLEFSPPLKLLVPFFVYPFDVLPDRFQSKL